MNDTDIYVNTTNHIKLVLSTFNMRCTMSWF